MDVERLLSALLTKLVPDQAGVLWIGGLVTFLVFANLERWRSRRNLTLCALLVMAPLLVDLIHWRGRAAALIFAAIYVFTACYAVWALVLGFKETGIRWSPNLSRRGLLALLAVVLTLNAVIVFGRPPDDAGYYTNLAAQRWTETGNLPYGDPLLKGPGSPAHGAAATYGPLLYASHVPFQWVLGPRRNPADANPADPAYIFPRIPHVKGDPLFWPGTPSEFQGDKKGAGDNI